MSSNKISYKEYWDEVKTIVDDAIKEAKGAARPEEAAQRYVQETVDGHQWVIYTWANPYVLIHTQNEDALFDGQGSTEADSYSGIMQQMAVWAMMADVEAELSGRTDELEEEESEEEEPEEEDETLTYDIDVE